MKIKINYYLKVKIMKNNYLSYFLSVFMFLGVNTASNAQLVVEDHEGNEYEYAKLADGRNWMLENLRMTTDRGGNPIHHYWRPNSEVTSYGYDTKEEAAFAVGYAYLREEVLGSRGESDVRIYTARTQGLCPDGWYVPELVRSSTTADINALISSYGGIVSAYNADAKWDAFKTAFRLTPVGYGFGKFQIDETTKEVILYQGGLHMITSGHLGKSNVALLLNVSSWTGTWGGYEENADRAGYCRCVENIQSDVTFSNFSAFGVDIAFSEPLRKNYGFAEVVLAEDRETEIPVDDICPRNFLIKEYETGSIIPVDEVFKSEDYKTVQISANLDESKIYELIMVDSKLTDKPYGGYTFNGGMKMYFPTAPSGVNLIEDLNVKINVVDNMLVVEQFGTSLNASIYNLRGERLLSFNDLNGLSYLNISNLTKGLYIIRLADNVNGGTIAKKFVLK